MYIIFKNQESCSYPCLFTSLIALFNDCQRINIAFCETQSEHKISYRAQDQQIYNVPLFCCQQDVAVHLT